MRELCCDLRLVSCNLTARTTQMTAAVAVGALSRNPRRRQPMIDEEAGELFYDTLAGCCAEVCPFARVQGVPRDLPVRRSLRLTNWEAANRKIQAFEIHAEKEAVSRKDACENSRPIARHGISARRRQKMRVCAGRTGRGVWPGSASKHKRG
jgi:hypothetical protein